MSNPAEVTCHQHTQLTPFARRFDLLHLPSAACTNSAIRQTIPLSDRTGLETQQYYRKHPGLPAECRLNQTKEGKKDGKPLKRASALVLRAGSCDLAVYQEQVWWSLVGSSHRTIKGRLRCDNQERKEKEDQCLQETCTAENSTALNNGAGSHFYIGSL